MEGSPLSSSSPLAAPLLSPRYIHHNTTKPSWHNIKHGHIDKYRHIKDTYWSGLLWSKRLRFTSSIVGVSVGKIDFWWRGGKALMRKGRKVGGWGHIPTYTQDRDKDLGHGLSESMCVCPHKHKQEERKCRTPCPKRHKEEWKIVVSQVEEEVEVLMMGDAPHFFV